MSLDRLITIITANTYQDLQNNQKILLTELEQLNISPKQQQDFIKKIIKFAKFTSNLKLRESYLRSYLRIFQEDIHFDGRGGSIVVEVTKKCTKHCIHCYSRCTGQREYIADDVLDLIINIARKHFKHVFLTGGEPTLDNRVFTLAKNNPDIIFFMLTNGGKITQNYASRLSTLGNLIPILGIDGNSPSTHNALRGGGSYREVMNAIENLNTHGVPWGYISLVTSINIDEVLSEEFIKDKINKGAFLARYLEYIPVGMEPNMDLILSGRAYYLLEKRKNEIINSNLIYMQKTTQPKCNGLLYFDVDGNIKNCFCFHYAKYNISKGDIGTSIKKTRKDWTSYHWTGECPIYADPRGFKNHLEKLGWKNLSTTDEPYLNNPEITQQLVHNYQEFLKIKANQCG
ncbi:MAG: radical SAM protein [Thermoplasmatales archaeon]|nr:MAG: radical SAM protein [Thermoplasmatales archaeon]